MALQAINNRHPYTVPHGDSLDDQVVENSLNVEELLLPKLIFYNTHDTQSVTLTLYYIIDLGISAVPEDNGTITITPVTAQPIAALTRYVYTPDFQSLKQYTSTPSITHYVTLANAGAEDVIVQMIMSGVAEVATRVNILNFQKSLT